MGIDDDIAAFVAAHTFRCEKLRCMMQKSTCIARQRITTPKDGYGWGAGRIQTPADKFCRSGECQQGLVIALGVRRKTAAIVPV